MEGPTGVSTLLFFPLTLLPDRKVRPGHPMLLLLIVPSHVLTPCSCLDLFQLDLHHWSRFHPRRLKYTPNLQPMPSTPILLA